MNATRTPTPAATDSSRTPDFAAIKTRQQETWSSGDYGVIGTTVQIVGETLCEAADVRSGEKVLDVAAGNGNASLAAARRYATVMSTDYVPQLLDQGRARATGERLPMEFTVADAEDLPFPDDSFDVALSTFGVMFTPNQQRTASEMMRVVRPGGRIGLANWTPESFIGDLFRTIGSFVAPPAGIASPLAWGTETRITELFGPNAADIRCTRPHFTFRYRSPEHFVNTFRTFYGPAQKAFAALDEARQDALHSALIELLTRHNRASGALVVPSEYLEVVVTTR
jgi:SAM-dependent methyltransferase